jgi:tRNA pseudouridine55 synthase
MLYARFMDEILLVDKPSGWTSFDVVAKIRGKIRADYVARGEKPTKRQLKVGHAGTLDPFATGLLIILLGDATKKADEFLKQDKTYEFTAKLGETSTTGDPEGDIAVSSDQTAVSKEEVETVLKQFTGDITQVPPIYSAIKIDGKRAYKLAREGKAVEMPSRQVRIDRLEVVSYEYPYLKCVCDVSSGTYIRSLVTDIGQALGTGAYCTELRRTRVGAKELEDAQTIDKIV